MARAPDAPPLWIPSADRIANANLTAFAARVSADGPTLADFSAVHQWSVTHPEQFWSAVWNQCDVVGDPGARVLDRSEDWACERFFPDATLNVAENLLRRSDDEPSLVFVREDGLRRVLTWSELHRLVARMQRALRGAEVSVGDRVAAWLPNVPEAYALMIACAGLGAVYSSCSPDFGVQGVLDRFGQIDPVVLVGVDGYLYDGRPLDCIERLAELVAQLPTVRAVPVLSYLDPDSDLSSVPGGVPFEDWLGTDDGAPVETVALPFDHPLYVLFSSGTTGLPKSIVHRAGGILLKHLVEHRLQCDVRAGDRVFYFTTTGWMMWNWLASALASEATLLLYDGSPVARGGNVLWDLAGDESVTLFGASAKFIDTCRKLGLHPARSHNLGALRTITSTGSPLAPEAFEYVYAHVKGDVHLASISGGTDLCGCLVAGDPTSPVWAGEIQRPGLGMAIDVLDDDGRPCAPGQPGELVCRAPFPSMPLGFWNDSDGSRYRAAYFERFVGVWHQGDFAEWTEHDGVIIHGRSDATLNPGGVRIGTAEIYRQVESLDAVLESLAIGQERDGDVRVVLFVVLRDAGTLTDELRGAIRQRIRDGASPRHVPARIVEVADLPRTRSGKLSELAVRDVVHGRAVRNAEALANPDALAAFRDLADLAE
jgi:acetoacetyl-CoA synthetase